MSQLTEQMDKFLQSEHLSHSLSKESLKSMLGEIKQLAEKVDFLTSDLEFAESKRAEASSKLNSAREANSVLIGKNLNYEKREKDLLSCELICTKTEIRNEFENRYGDEFCSLVNKILDNRIIRENINSTCPVKETYKQDCSNRIAGFTNEAHINVTGSKTCELKED